jgi:flagellar protein FlaG
MASVSASHLILFIASMVIAASVAGVFTDTVGQLSTAISDQGLDVSSDIRTDFEIISDSGSSAIFDSGTITLHLKNTGSEVIPAEGDQMDVFVNGSFTTDLTVTPLEGSVRWQPGEVVRLEIDENIGTGDHRIKVIINSDEEVFEFNR